MSAYRTDCQGCQEKNEFINQCHKELNEQKQQYRQAKEELDKIKARNYWGTIVYASAWVGAVIIAGTTVGTAAYGCATKPPDPLGPCQDSVEIISIKSTQRTCHPEAAIAVELLPRNGAESQTALVRCWCPRTAASEHEKIP